MKHLIIFLSALIYTLDAAAQYAPQAGVAGSTAIPASSNSIVGWATRCELKRGWMNIADTTLGLTSNGDSSVATGPVDRFVVSLGDSGVATLTFNHPITNGSGPDFVVFENGFSDPADPEMAFLELAFVEVSSDGNKFFRFPATSHTQAEMQIAGSGTYMDARKINNLAGKYVTNYGTPFDLEALSDREGLDINNITHVRIVDVTGAIGAHQSLDNDGRVINDPYPTDFPTGGFDLDAVGVLHQNTSTSIAATTINKAVVIYPNPVSDRLTIKAETALNLMIMDITGKIVWNDKVQAATTISLTDYSRGSYMLCFTNDKGEKWLERISKL